MHPIETCVRNPVKVAVGALLLILFGGIALLRMPMQLIPEVETPALTIETRWPGASPQEIEREIIREQEEQLKSVQGLTKMSSESTDSVGRIVLEFYVGTPLDEALLKVNSQLQQVSDYPQDAKPPVISTSNASDRPIAWFILSPIQTKPSELEALAAANPHLADRLAEVLKVRDNPGLMLYRLRKLAERWPEVAGLLPPELNVPQQRRFAEDVIKARFERVEGVSLANVIGGLEEEMQVLVDPEKLAARQLTIADVRRVLRDQNKDTSGGDYWEGKRRYVVRTVSQFRSPEDVLQQVLASRDGRPVYVRDVAEVQLGYKKPDGLVRRFGTNTIAVNTLRQVGANVLTVMDGLKEAVDELNRDVLADRQLQLTQVYDETEYIYSSINLVNQNIIIGSSLTMMVLMLFLHLQLRVLIALPLILLSALAAVWLSPWMFLVSLVLIVGCGFWFARGALVVGLALPISIIGTFLLMQLWGRSLNVISLAGMAFAVGMLVDNAVVVLENIYRHFQEGKPPLRAAVEGAQEVWGAVLASTLTTLAVFLPVLFVQQEAGQLFGDIALAISAAVGLSLLISISVIPTATARLLVRQPTPPGRATGPIGWFGFRWLVQSLQLAGQACVTGVVGINAMIQQRLWRRLAVVLSLVLAAAGTSWWLWPAVEYLPSGNRNLVFGILLPPPGYNLDELMRIGEIVEEHVLPYWDVDPDVAESGELAFPAIYDFFFVARGRQVFMGMRTLDPTRSGELVPLVQQVRDKVPGTIVVANQASLFAQGLSAGRSIDLEITGPELTRLVQLGGQVMGKVGELMPAAQARPVPSLDLSSPEVHIRPRLLQTQQMGVDATALGYTMDALVDGAYAGDYFVGGDKIDLSILSRSRSVERSQDLLSLPVATPGGQLVPLSALAEVELASGPEQINHRERQRAITIQITPPVTIPLEGALELINREIIAPSMASGDLDGGYRMVLSGTADKLRDTWDALRWNVLLALLITYLLMAALFESWLHPLVIMLSVPLGAVGGILGLRWLGLYLGWQGIDPQPLDVLTMLGFVILIGTVVNNAILIVHQSINLLRLGELAVGEAILQSVRTRIRPIAMTTATTILGLAPLVLFPGAGSELYRGLGSVLLGGLLVSTIFTLVFVPTLLRLSLDMQRLWSGIYHRPSRLQSLEEIGAPAGKSTDPVAA